MNFHFNKNKNTDWPGEAADTHQLLYIPQTDQSICTSCGKVFSCGVELDTDAIGRVSVDGLNGLQLWITANSQFILAQKTQLETCMYVCM